jgi:predicted N-acetyltransferase YhbS
MFEITIRTESDRDVEAIKDLLENASEEGEIAEPFEVRVDEVPE